MVQFGPAVTTLLMIPWANAGPAIKPAVATETKSARSFTPYLPLRRLSRGNYARIGKTARECAFSHGSNTGEHMGLSCDSHRARDVPQGAGPARSSASEPLRERGCPASVRSSRHPGPGRRGVLKGSPAFVEG